MSSSHREGGAVVPTTSEVSPLFSLCIFALQQDGEGAGAGSLDWEDSAGISAPLYDIVDVVFELGSRGFFRRQVIDDDSLKVERESCKVFFPAGHA